MIEAAPDNSYFEWLCDRTGDTRKAECPEESFMSLLEIMHQTPFRVTIQNDINRAQDGIDLRRRLFERIMMCPTSGLTSSLAPCSRCSSLWPSVWT